MFLILFTLYGKDSHTKQGSAEHKISAVLYILTSVWVLHTPKAGRKSHFQHFFCKKTLEKQEICSKFLQKTRFLSLHQNAGPLFYSLKNELFSFLGFLQQKRWLKYRTCVCINFGFLPYYLSILSSRLLLLHAKLCHIPAT